MTEEEAARARRQLRARFVFETDSVTNIAHQLGYFETVTGPGFFAELQSRVDARDGRRGVRGGAPAAAAVEPHRRLVQPLPTSGAPAVTTAAVRGLSPVRTVLDSGAVVIVQETPITPAVTDQRDCPCRRRCTSRSDHPGLAFLTGRVLDRGTAHRSAEVIAEELDDRGVALRVATSRHTTVVSCTCLSEDFDDVLSIVLDIVRSPVFPEHEVSKRRADCISAIRQDEDNPSVRAVETLFELLYGAVASVRPPGEGNGRERRAHHRAAISRRSTPRGSGRRPCRW